MNQELPDAQAGFRKGRGTTDQIANIRWIIGKAREFQENIYFIDYSKQKEFSENKLDEEIGTCTVAFISHASKVILKILQARLQQYVNHELPHVQAGFRKGRGTRDQMANIRWITEKAREFQKISISALLTMPKPLTVWITINCGQF